MRNGMQQGRCRSYVMTMAAASLLLSISGCASEPIRATPTVTPDQVRSNAEKGFERLKQEEQNRPGNSGGAY